MPIRVLMFGWELPPYNSGGLGTACEGLTRALACQNIDITFVLPKKVDIKPDHMRLVFADLEGLDWPMLSASVYELPKLLLPGVPPELARDLISAVNQYALRAGDIAKKYKFDVIHAHDWLCFPAGVVAGQVSHHPLISHVHATEFDRGGGNGVNPVVYSLERYGLEQSHSVIAVSEFTKRLLARHYATPVDKVDVVHNGIDAGLYTTDADTTNPLLALKQAGYQIVLFLGRFTLQKGPDYFLKAARRTLDYKPNTVFIMAGSGEMERQLINLSIDLGISDKVLFTGFLRDDAWTQAFKAADLFVMPSVSEPFGLTALESVALGTPAIISKQSGVSESLSHVLKVDFWDTEEMANQMISVLDHASLHSALRNNSHKEVKKVSWAAAASKTIEIYKKILSKFN